MEMASIVTSCTGNKDLVTAPNWVFRGFVNMFTILGIIVLATTMAIQSIIIDVLEKFSATSLESFIIVIIPNLGNYRLLVQKAIGRAGEKSNPNVGIT